MIIKYQYKNQKILEYIQDLLTRRPVELNHIPHSGTIRLSDDDQNLLASASSNLRNTIINGNKTKNNISIAENVVSGSVNGNMTSSDNHYQYSQTENNVNPKLWKNKK